MVLQRIIASGNNPENLYVRQIDEFGRDLSFEYGVEKCVTKAFPIKMMKGEILSFDTYYNSFEAEKWSSYTTVKSVNLVVEAKGSLDIRIINVKKVVRDDGHIINSKEEISVDCQVDARSDATVCSFELDIFNVKGIIYPVITANSDTELISIRYEDNVELDNDNVAIVVFASNDIRVTKEFIKKLNIYESRLQYSLCVCDVRGGLWDGYFGENVCVISKKETVGSLKNKALSWAKELKASHILFLGENSLLNLEALENTFAFIRRINEHNKDLIVQGITINETIVENAGYFSQGKNLLKRGCDIDISNFLESKILLEKEDISYPNENVIIYPVGVFDSEFDSKLNKYTNRNFAARFDKVRILEYNSLSMSLVPTGSEGLIKKNYFDTMDELISRCGTRLEFTKDELKSELKRRIFKEIKYGNYIIIEVIIKAIEDFLSVDFFDEAKREELNTYLKKLQEQHNQILSGHKSNKAFTNLLKVIVRYNELCVRINNEYDKSVLLWEEYCA